MSYDEDEDDFDYEEFIEREFGSRSDGAADGRNRVTRARSVPYHWQLVAMALVALFALSIWISLGFWTPF